MGEYERTEKRINELEEEIKELKRAYRENDMTDDELDELIEQIMQCNQAIGECKGYLNELAELDGYCNYEEYLFD